MSKRMSSTRILKLANIYGPFARFSPEGSEAADEAIKSAEEADLVGNAVFDKARQAADQEKANATKARERADAATTQLTEANSTVESLKSQLAEANAKANAAGVDVKLDKSQYSDTDLPIVNAIEAINKKLEAKDVEINNLKQKASDFETNKANEQAKANEDKVYQDLLGDMDVDYGPEYRNAAVTAFEKKVAAGEVKGGAAKATRMLEKCYKDAVKTAAEKDTAAKKASGTGNVLLDSGSGGGTGVSLSGVELQTGSLEDVTSQAGKAINKSP